VASTSPQRFDPPHPVVIGLLGGVAAGKSTVAQMMAETGLALLDADAVAREVAARPEVREAIRRRFGPTVFGTDGALDRARLARVVFADDAARRDLEAITHPPIRRALEAALDRALAAGRSVVLDVPLLLEGGLIERCDHVVFLDVDPAVRRARAAARGWDDAEVARREAAQAPLEEKRERSDHVLDAGAPLDGVRRQVEAYLVGLSRPPGRGRAGPS
jgi:dephospho-CoA kinase